MTATLTHPPKAPRIRASDELATLHAHLDLLHADGQTTPCQAGDWRLWLSEAQADIAQAATACRTCPVVTTCRAAGQHEHAGVWGGEGR